MGPDRVPAVRARLTQIGQQEGIDFSFAGKIGNTRDSHRLIQLGQTKGNEMENRIVSELFKSHFEGEGDITSHDTLTQAAVKAGLDEEEVRKWLEEGSGGDAVDREVQDANTLGIHGVPHITIQGNHIVDGAQDPQEFLDAFFKVKKGGSK